MNTALTSRDIASMTAHAAGIKAENNAHTEGPWRVGRAGCVVSDHPVAAMHGSDEIDYYGGHLIAESVTGPNARRIVACVNACAGIPTETLESAAHWSPAIHHTAPAIPAEAAHIGAALDGESLEQGEVL